MAIATNIPNPPYHFLDENKRIEFLEIYQQMKRVKSSSNLYFHINGKQLDTTTVKAEATSVREIQKFTADYRTILTPYHFKNHKVDYLFKLLEKVNKLQERLLQESEDPNSSLNALETDFDKETESHITLPTKRKDLSYNNVILEDNEPQIFDDENEDEDVVDEEKFVKQVPNRSAWYLIGCAPSKNSQTLDIIDADESSVEDDDLFEKLEEMRRQKKIRSDALREQLYKKISALHLSFESEINFRIHRAPLELLEIGILEPIVFISNNLYNLIYQLSSEMLSILKKRTNFLFNAEEFKFFISKENDINYLNSLNQDSDSSKSSQSRLEKLKKRRIFDIQCQLYEKVSRLGLPFESECVINSRIREASRQVLEVGILVMDRFINDEKFYYFIAAQPPYILSILEKRPQILSNPSELSLLLSEENDLEYLDSLLVRKASTKNKTSLAIFEQEIQKFLSKQPVDLSFTLKKKKVHFNDRVTVFDKIFPETIPLNKNDRSASTRTPGPEKKSRTLFQRSGDTLEDGPDINYYAHDQIARTDMGKIKETYLKILNDKLNNSFIKSLDIPAGFYSSAIDAIIEVVENFLGNLKTDSTMNKEEDANILLRIKTRYKVLLYSEYFQNYAQTNHLYDLTEHAINAFNETIDLFKDNFITKIISILSR